MSSAQQAIASPTLGPPQATVLPDSPGQGKPVYAGDIRSLLQNQHDAIRWNLTLNQAISSWVDEHELAMAHTPASAGSAVLQKRIQFDDCLDSPLQLKDSTSGANANLRVGTKRVESVQEYKQPPFLASQGMPSSTRIQAAKSVLMNVPTDRIQAAKLGGNLSPVAGSSSSLMEPLLSNASSSVAEEFKQTEPGRQQSSGKGRVSSKEYTLGLEPDMLPCHLKRSMMVSELLFPQPDEATLIVQGHLDRPDAKDEDQFKHTGMYQAVARSKWFSNLSMMVIFLNTIWIAIDTDYNKHEMLCNAPLLFQVVDNFFCIFFCWELIVRFNAYVSKMTAISDPWFVFDAVLVSFMVWETWIQVLLYWTVGAESFEYGRTATILRVFRLARLTRVARTGKLLRSAPELMILAKAMFLALRSVLAVLAMLSLVLYVFAILFTQLLSGEPLAMGKFENVPQSFNFLLIQLLCGFDSQFMEHLIAAGLLYYFTFLLFLLIANMTIMNMLIGILCDVVSGVSESAKEENFVLEIRSHLDSLAEKIDPDGDRLVTRKEFIDMMHDYNFVQALNNTGVDVLSFVAYAAFVFSDDVQLSFYDFTRLIVQFRGDRVATVKELVSTRKYVTKLFESMEIDVPVLRQKS